MLDTNPNNIAAINDAIIYVHRNNVLPPGIVLPGVAINAAGALTIDYGYQGIRYGSIEITRGQFEVTRVTNVAGTLILPANYNHAGANTTKQNYIDALKCDNLTLNQTFLSALITLTSECCRSAMVSSAIGALMNNHGNFSNDVWIGLQFAFNTYSHTALFRGYEIQAGGSPWTWLGASDYIAYINSPGYTGDRTLVTKIAAVKSYNNSAA
jgi:hypothetical protein